MMENNKLNAKVVDLQQKIASQTLEIETLKRNNDSLRNVGYFFLSNTCSSENEFVFFNLSYLVG